MLDQTCKISVKLVSDWKSGQLKMNKFILFLIICINLIISRTDAASVAGKGDKPNGPTAGYVLVCLPVFIGIFIWFYGFCYFMDQEDPDAIVDYHKVEATTMVINPKA